MSWRVFLAVVAVALVNVAVGLDWLNAPEAPPRISSLQTPIVYPTPSPPPAAAPAKASAPAQASVPPKAPAPAPAQAAAPRPAPVTSAAAVAEPAPEASEARAQAPAAPPGCNVAACEAHYKSFRAADCTYQPNDGPRRLCRRK